MTDGLCTATVAACGLLMVGMACASGPDLPDVEVIDGDPIATLLPPDRIPAIDDPSFVPADEADFVRDDEPVLGVVRNGVAKAYSLWHLDRHEIVNDEFAGEEYAVTW